MKYVLMFFTFLSVCNASDLLKIPLILDAENSFTIPSGITSVDETFVVDPSQDADFQSYLTKIKEYEIDSVRIAFDSWTGPANTMITGKFTLPDAGLTWDIGNINLSTGTFIPVNFNASEYLNFASKLSAKGQMKVNFKGAISNGTGGPLKIKMKIYLKIKVI